ncbi:hypothetical protein SAMN05444144_109142 [Flavobacterium akiainvivens]|nr:hypothetical protein SAMN05444144_109142 [Flavobacterium akiainvivens]
MQILINDITFPALAFPNDGILHLASKPNDLIICNSKGFKNGFYNNLMIIDATGKSFRVLNAQKTRKVGCFSVTIYSLRGNTL